MIHLTWGDFKEVMDKKVPDETEIDCIDIDHPLDEEDVTIEVKDGKVVVF